MRYYSRRQFIYGEIDISKTAIDVISFYIKDIPGIKEWWPWYSARDKRWEFFLFLERFHLDTQEKLEQWYFEEIEQEGS